MVTGRNERRTILAMPRRVKFFGASVGGPPHGSPVNYDISEQLIDAEQLQFLPTAGRDSRYLDTDTGRFLFTMVDHHGPEVCFRLCRVDRDNLPQTEKGGNIAELLLDDETGLTETTYGVIFEPGLIGVVSSKGGPSMSRIAGYLKNKSTSVPSKLTISPLVHIDIIAKLREFETLSLFHLKLHPSQLPIIKGQWDVLDDNFEAQLNLWREQSTLEVTVSPTRNSQRRSHRSLMGPIVSLAQSATGLLIKRSSKFIVKGQPEGMLNDVVLNILSETLSVEQEIAKSAVRSSALDAESAYNAIRLSYNDLQNDIRDAMRSTQ